jgi:hypothetical protein
MNVGSYLHQQDAAWAGAEALVGSGSSYAGCPTPSIKRTMKSFAGFIVRTNQEPGG